jgi:hypothetical protein
VRLHVDVTLLAAFAFPLCAGWLAGAVVQEFQHTSFGALLPAVRRRVAAGFLTAGLALSTVVVGSIALRGDGTRNLPLLFVVALGAYCFGGIFRDPLSNWVTTVNVVLALSVIVNSRRMAAFAEGHPWTTVLVASGIGAGCFLRLFARSTFRRKPFRATAPLPGRYSVEKTQRYRTRLRVEAGPGKTTWSPGYLGVGLWRWVRAAIHEVHGSNLRRDNAKALIPLAYFTLLCVGHAWAERGDLSLGEAVARTIYDALFRSPHQPVFGEKGSPFLFVAIAVAAVGVVTALFRPVTLNPAMAHPLSRRQLAAVRFRGGLADAAILLAIPGLGLFALGHLAGWLAGYEIRFDFLPFFFRVLLITLVLMPLAHWGQLRLQEATRRKSENTIAAVIFGIVGFVGAVWCWTFVSPRLFVSPVVELATLVAALLVSQLIYRRNLTSYYRTADLA